MTAESGPQRMWLLQKLTPQTTALNLGLALEVSGELDRTTLDDAVLEMTRRHPILRSRYSEDADGELVVREDDEGRGLLSVMRAETTEERDALVRREFAYVFDPQREHSIRVNLIESAPSRHVLVVVAHHIVWDDGCWAPYCAELTTIYDAAPRARGAHLDEPSTVRRGDAANSMSYWRALLANLPEPIEFPGEKGLTRTAETGSATVRFELSDVETTKLTEFAGEAGEGVFTMLLTSFEILMARLCRSRDLLIALPVANRDTDADRHRIGYLGNTLVLRARIDSASTVGVLLADTAQAHRDAVDHADAPIDDIVRSINPDRHGGVDSVVRLCFSERTTPSSLFAPRGTQSSVLTHDIGQSQIPLSLDFESVDGRLVLRFEYQTDVLSADSVAAIQGAYLHVLRSICHGDRARAVSDIDVLPPDQRAHVLGMSSGAIGSTTPRTIGELVAAQVRRTPDADAIVDDLSVVSYAELDRRSTRVAHLLHHRGIEPGDTVAVLSGHSIELVVTALGIVKAGAVYVPLDIGLPRERLEYMLADARPAAVFGAPESLDCAGAQRVELGDEPADRMNETPTVSPAGGAYIVYTSATTGPPKGVVVSHSAIVDYIEWITGHGQLGPGDSVLQVASTGFDVSIGEIFGCLASGARLVVPRPGGLADVSYLTDLLDRRDITSMHFVPSLLATFLTLPGVERWTTLRRVPVGGEALPGQLADRFNALFDARLYNFYGPTETTLAVTRYEVDVAQGFRTVPIGLPKDNTQVYVLDERLRPVTIGVIGEVYVGGSQLALGYHGRPGHTADRFVADPFADGGRLYRTGDLGRWSPDDGLEFIGRVDQQVKIRGFRIERAEVESVVAAAAGVENVLVEVVEHSVRGKVLIAYVVMPADAAPDLESRVRAAAAASLPDYMIPERIIAVSRIPLTPNGKLDRTALPTPDFPARRAGRAASTDTERALCAVVAELVGVPEVGVDDSFFDVGGHSLLAVRLASRLRARFGVDVPIRTVFDTPTVAELAEFVDLAAVSPTKAVSALRPPIAPTDHSLRAPLSAAQSATWSAYDPVRHGATDNVVFGAELTGPIDAGALEQAVRDVVGRHRVLRTAYGSEQGSPVQRHLGSSAVTLTRTRSDASTEDLMRRAAWRRLDIADSLPIAAELVDRLHAPDLMVIVIHHIAADRWSAPVLFADLVAAYRARRSGSAPSWPPLALQYHDVAAWQALLPAAMSQYEHGFDEPVQLAVAETVDVDLTDAVDDAFDRITARHALDVSVAAAAVTTVLVRAFTGRDDVVVWTPIPEHTPPATDALIGPLVTSVALRTTLDRGADAASVVAAVRESMQKALAHSIAGPISQGGRRIAVVVDDVRGPTVRLDARGESTLTSLSAIHPSATTDLTVVFRRGTDGMRIALEYRPEYYSEFDVAELSALVSEVICEMDEYPDRPVIGSGTVSKVGT